MATYLGKDGIVKVGATPAAIGEITDFSLSIEATAIEDTSMGDTWRTRKAGLLSWSGNVSCHFDSDDSAQLALTEGSEVAVEFYPEGAAGYKLSGSVVATGVEISGGGVDGVVSAQFSFEGNGALTRA